MMIRFGLAVLAAFTSLMAPAMAQDGQPGNWEVNFQTPATDNAQQMLAFHNLLFFIIVGIVLFVTALLIYVMIRFNERANPTPSRTTHNTLIEVLWTVIPVMILVVIAVPSFRVLAHQLNLPENPEVIIKVTGYQWYWGYEYVDTGLNGGDAGNGAELASDAAAAAGAEQAVADADEPAPIEFMSVIVPEAQRQPGQPRLLAVDNEVVVPVNRNVVLQVTAADVIHAFGVPSFGVKIDAVPGRINTTWFNVNREGIFYGQCYELCGRDHAFMPIAVRVVSEEEYRAWVEQRQTAAAPAAMGRATAALGAAR